jgi:acyl-CoA reductase-like NAD-dependent aldehyde dehydrogenase
MASVFNRTTPEYRPSVHTPNFDVADWAINPDIVAAAGQPVRYWFLTGATNAEGQEIVDIVDAATQTSIDAAIAATKEAAEKDGAKTQVDVERVVRALVDLLPSEFNILRALHSLPDRTAAQVNAALKANIDAQ